MTKKWTVMLIPHDRGDTQTLNLSAYQLWLVAAILVALSFTSAFFYGRHQGTLAQVNRLRAAVQDLEKRCTAQVAVANQNAMTPQERTEIENRIRAQYDSTIAAITAELGELYDMETQARNLTGLAPRTAAKETKSLSLTGGKGGGSGNLGDFAFAETEPTAAPPQIIYGLSNPSADLLIQEINLRTASLAALVGDLKVREDQIQRLPSIMPVTGTHWRLTSPFGYRKDPFTYRVSMHTGTDISAPTGTPILATARGVVKAAGRDGALGNCVCIDHGNGIETVYAHLQSIGVNVGETVDRKAVIGRLGSSGRTTGPHLHYEVLVNGKPVDPRKYFRD